PAAAQDPGGGAADAADAAYAAGKPAQALQRFQYTSRCGAGAKGPGAGRALHYELSRQLLTIREDRPGGSSFSGKAPAGALDVLARILGGMDPAGWAGAVENGDVARMRKAPGAEGRCTWSLSAHWLKDGAPRPLKYAGEREGEDPAQQAAEDALVRFFESLRGEARAQHEFDREQKRQAGAYAIYRDGGHYYLRMNGSLEGYAVRVHADLEKKLQAVARELGLDRIEGRMAGLDARDLRPAAEAGARAGAPAAGEELAALGYGEAGEEIRRVFSQAAPAGEGFVELALAFYGEGPQRREAWLVYPRLDPVGYVQVLAHEAPGAGHAAHEKILDAGEVRELEARLRGLGLDGTRGGQGEDYQGPGRMTLALTLPGARPARASADGASADPLAAAGRELAQWLEALLAHCGRKGE
ncbi:MAG: hypothetical protein HUK26_09670, partial [Duodenibacillus sp.]|nr:hypothetical protein [Duodenibacillus sp.]